MATAAAARNDIPQPALTPSRAEATNGYMQPAIPRPEQEAAVAEGLVLTATCSQDTCTPTCAAVNTSRFPYRTGLIRPILAGDAITTTPWEGKLSVAGLLSDAGFHTMLVGKWHIGEAGGMRPRDVGFDEFCGFYKAQKEHTQDICQMRFPDPVPDEDKLERYHAIGSDNNLIHGLKKGTTEVIETIDSTEKMAESDRLLRDCTVKRLGELEITFSVVPSYNGPQMDSWPDSGYTPFRGAKGTTWDGGVRVPGIAYWAGMIPPGRRSDGLFNFSADPKEDYRVGHRMTAWTASPGNALKAHAATFKKFPPKDLGL